MYDVKRSVAALKYKEKYYSGSYDVVYIENKPYLEFIVESSSERSKSDVLSIPLDENVQLMKKDNEDEFANYVIFCAECIHQNNSEYVKLMRYNII